MSSDFSVLLIYTGYWVLKEDNIYCNNRGDHFVFIVAFSLSLSLFVAVLSFSVSVFFLSFFYFWFYVFLPLSISSSHFPYISLRNMIRMLKRQTAFNTVLFFNFLFLECVMYFNL